MSLLGKLMDTMRLSSEDDEDDYYLDDDFEDEDPKKGLFSKRNNTEKQLYLIWKEFIWKPRSGSLISLPEQLIP